ncbi:MAG: hypothetical protein KF878_02885 [Planctomycetes bacterium]|nr:hypothetical protein [Planctomycetota bacterium]
MRRAARWWTRRRGELHPILGVPAFLLAIALSMPLYALIDRSVPGPRDSPAMLFPYLCCAFLPAAALTFGVALALQSAFGRATRRALGTDTPEDHQAGCLLPVRLSPQQTLYLCALAALGCIAFAAWPRPSAPRAPTPEAAPTDPEARARDLARRAAVQRLSPAGVQGMTLDARRVTVAGRPVWRVTTRGAVQDLVVDVGDGTRPDRFGGQGPVVDVFLAGSAPLEDVEAPDAAPVGSD